LCGTGTGVVASESVPLIKHNSLAPLIGALTDKRTRLTVEETPTDVSAHSSQETTNGTHHEPVHLLYTLVSYSLKINFNIILI
jgi:hypothetical protein